MEFLTLKKENYNPSQNRNYLKAYRKPQYIIRKMSYENNISFDIVCSYDSKSFYAVICCIYDKKNHIQIVTIPYEDNQIQHIDILSQLKDYNRFYEICIEHFQCLLIESKRSKKAS